MSKTITVQTTIHAPIDKVWEMWNEPKHITKWNSAIETWHTPTAENDLRVGGKLKARMEAKDKSQGFDFEATYNKVEKNKLIEYTIADGRKVNITFEKTKEGIKIIETFEMEQTNPEELQRGGWQAILDNFRKYAESMVHK